jgi:citrate lyase subunit beta/citryl-CoA lyase
LEKGRSLPADGLILDLEDAVAPDAKEAARDTIRAALAGEGAYGRRELLVRVNGLDTPWGHGDLVAMARAGADGILLPKVESADAITRAAVVLAAAGASVDLPIWSMMETPRGILRSEEIASHPRSGGLVMGTSDLTKDLTARHTAARLPMLVSLGTCLLAARAAGVPILDGVHLDLGDEAGLEQSCRQGVELGFDGKTLIHPKQIGAANASFGPTEAEIAWADWIIAAFAEAEAAGKGLVLVDGKLVENLHIVEARRLKALAVQIAAG